MKRLLTYLVIGTGIYFAACTAQSKTEVQDDGLATLETVIQQASDQYKYLKDRLPDQRFPKTYHANSDKLETSGSGWWCSGFYPGSLLYMYEQNQDKELLEEAERILSILEKEKHNTTTHDLGFMMFCSFGNALEIAPKEAYKAILIQSAESLSSRFDENVGLIKSWDSKEGDYLVIIDNMMNLELLFWASEETGDPKYKEIAITHADNTIKHHFREDNSSYHVVNYNPTTGEVTKKHTAQGYSDDSAWARGQAWGLYGYTVMYRFTKDQKYLDQAVKIANFMLDHPNLPADKIPYWDFDAPNIPDALRDSSAGAIAAAALLELTTYVDQPDSKRYFDDAEKMIFSLASAPYLAEPNSNGGFILKHGVGHIPENTEVDTPLTYGDYYFLEAIKRYKNQLN
ncbi:glycoside hydrolase family 88 protein [Belliella kenyensis]|uniref:Glycoside hydrolase family 88 protein n=1 Tax=Belliella kenyensis TaxID=1472724 RepID=A0ABV8EH22_9BACT|nr:glycoside hydrolase family 88 protein [Belliella kenyensis]MCH7400991.1 glycoside hydrolase family 88 protein [Belliella kenyensis]MDN3603989.1 glycoside hydrolase family 88 protein [Belliella kenyensis]